MLLVVNMAYYHRSSAAQRVRISVKDNAFGLIDEREKQFWVSFSTFLRPQSLLQRRNGDDKDVAVHAAIVSDLVHHLHSILNLGKGTSLSLSVDGYILPDNESLDVIHEMDVVHVDLKPCVSPCDNAMKKKVDLLIVSLSQPAHVPQLHVHSISSVTHT